MLYSLLYLFYMTQAQKQGKQQMWLWFWLAGLLSQFGWYKHSRYARYRSYGFTPKQIYIKSMRSQLSHAKKMAIFWRDHFTCYLCGRRFMYWHLEVDHVQALANRGGNQEWNVKTACRWYNRKKGIQSVAI